MFTSYFNLEVDETMLALLVSYRKKCAQNTAEGQLVLPETMPVLPLYVLCAHKMLALRTNNQVHKELLSPVLTCLGFLSLKISQIDECRDMHGTSISTELHPAVNASLYILVTPGGTVTV